MGARSRARLATPSIGPVGFGFNQTGSEWGGLCWWGRCWQQSGLAGRVYTDEDSLTYRFPPGLRVERVRVTETASTWAEYFE